MKKKDTQKNIIETVHKTVELFELKRKYTDLNELPSNLIQVIDNDTGGYAYIGAKVTNRHDNIGLFDQRHANRRLLEKLADWVKEHTKNRYSIPNTVDREMDYQIPCIIDSYSDSYSTLTPNTSRAFTYDIRDGVGKGVREMTMAIGGGLYLRISTERFNHPPSSNRSSNRYGPDPYGPITLGTVKISGEEADVTISNFGSFARVLSAMLDRDVLKKLVEEKALAHTGGNLLTDWDLKETAAAAYESLIVKLD